MHISIAGTPSGCRWSLVYTAPFRENKDVLGVEHTARGFIHMSKLCSFSALLTMGKRVTLLKEGHLEPGERRGSEACLINELSEDV